MIESPRVLAVTNMYPSERTPTAGTFVADQVESLRGVGLAIDLLTIDRAEGGRSVYRKLPGLLATTLAEKEYDLVHVMYGGVMAERATRSTSLPVVVSFCGSDLNGMPLGPLFARLSAQYGVWASRRAARRASAVITKTRALADLLPAGVDQGKVFVIPNGVDLDLFRPMDREECRRRLGWPNGREYVLTYGRDEGKRLDVARAAADRARTPDGSSVELKFLSGAAHAEVPIWLNGASAFLLTSVREGSPNVVKEALACDVPIVSTDVGDVRERVQAVEGCHIVEADPDSIAGALSTVLAGTGRVEGRRAVKDLSLEAVARRVEAVYRTALSTDTT